MSGHAGGSAQFVAIAARALAERWRTIAAWAAGALAIVAVQLSIYPSVASTSAGMQAFVDAWPEALREAFQLDAYTTGPGFLDTELFSLTVPLLLIGVGVTFAAAATAGEEERGTADLLWSLPLRRSTGLLAKAAAMAAAIAVPALLVAIGVLVGAGPAGLEVEWGNVVAAAAMNAALALVFGGIGILVGAATGSRAAAMGTAVAAAIAAFLLEALAPLADWLEPWRWLSPFAWASRESPIIAGMDWPMVGVLIGVTALLVAASLPVFARHDIRSR